ncbi:MAG: thioredoxin family protein [Arenicellales bacterium]|nr:thioredoxin family protein [Arenicellales bacterium]
MAETPSMALELGSAASDFNLPNTNPDYGGDTVSLSDYRHSKALLVVFMCNHCPYVIHIISKLVDVIKAYQPQGLEAVAISVNDVENYPDDAPDKMSAMAARYNFSFPYLYDESQQSAKDYQAVCTPDLYLYNGKLQLAYHGQFDRARPRSNEPITGSDLKQAIENVLNGLPVSSEQTPSVGCSIKWKPGQAP